MLLSPPAWARLATDEADVVDRFRRSHPGYREALSTLLAVWPCAAGTMERSARYVTSSICLVETQDYDRLQPVLFRGFAHALHAFHAMEGQVSTVRTRAFLSTLIVSTTALMLDIGVRDGAGEPEDTWTLATGEPLTAWAEGRDRLQVVPLPRSLDEEEAATRFASYILSDEDETILNAVGYPKCPTPH